MLGSQVLTGSLRRRKRARRIYGPRNLGDGYHRAKVKGYMHPVLDKIEKLYGQVTRNEQRHGHTLCFGLLDPVTNIVVNSILFPTTAESQPVGDVVQRSLNGLIAFLTYLFPYLPEAEAVEYLNVANADPLVAAHLIVAKRGMRQFGFNSAATVAAVLAALKCAAIAAGHPRPLDIAVGWTVLSPGLRSLLSLGPGPGLRSLLSLGPGNRPDAYAVVTSATSMLRNSNTWRHYLLLQQDVAEVLNRDLRLKDAWELAKMRVVNPVKELPPARGAIKRILLARIHGFYLQALGRLPTAELHKRYHRSMLMGGHCYGPLDPVSNIIFNTVWYEQTFSASTPELQMISTTCLWRIAARSLYGLVSFLCTRYHKLTPDLAMERLLVAEANLQLADPYLFGKLNPPAPSSSRYAKLQWGSGSLQVGPHSSTAFELQYLMVERSRPSSSVIEAYDAAATAGFHPDPSAQKVFLGSSDAVSKLKNGLEMLELQDGRVLSSMDLAMASKIVKSACSHHLQEPEPLKLSKHDYAHTLQCKNRFWGQHQRVSNMLRAALATFNKTVEHPYRIHITCGINELVSGPEFMEDKEPGGYNPWTPDIYHHSHINFLAVPEDQGSGFPVLFFAECSNKGSETSWCVPLSLQDAGAEQIRCIYCERGGNRILHPPAKHFHGRDIEFQKVLMGEPIYDESGEGRYTNDMLMEGQSEVIDWVPDDSIYYNYYADDNDDGDDEDWIDHFDVC